MKAATIPVIDLFAGPGGLGEGFAALRVRGRPAFRVALSIEKDARAHATLELRSFFRQFPDRQAPAGYYQHLRGELSREELFQRHPAEARRAKEEAWHAELGNEAEFPAAEVDRRIRTALDGARTWVLIGGPPCQAYSLIGRARLGLTDVANDPHERHELYTHYLRILAVHRPALFVMENVPGILSAAVRGEPIFQRILDDLQDPQAGVRNRAAGRRPAGLRYRLYPSVESTDATGLLGELHYEPRDFIIRTEEHGIPQTRHRIILLGVRADLDGRPVGLKPGPDRVPMWRAIADLPPIRSALSRELDSPEAWAAAVRRILIHGALEANGVEIALRFRIVAATKRLRSSLGTGGEFIWSATSPEFAGRWYYDKRLEGVCNHAARLHMAEDLQRYLFAACAARLSGESPRLESFPPLLRPAHQNVNGDMEGLIFRDRFRVQVRGSPATTITSHIARDGHYYIHPDPLQCRSLTVREAARLQTFPDNYLFCGPRTEQYKQVGNAVPPLLARRIAGVASGLLARGGAGR